MNKYFLVIKNTWDEIVTYRLNFVMWRVRTVLLLLTTYFLWKALIPANQQLFGYTQSLILTYVLGASLITALVFASRTQEIGDNINSGDLSIFLIRPINYFGYWLSRDIGDKAMNMSFSLIEIALLFILLRPPIFIQTNIIFILLMFIMIMLAVFLQFIIGSLLGMIGFWSPDIWAPRFIYMTLLSFLAGSIFPIDILPIAFRTVMQLLPFQYLLYFPLKIYLGQLTLIDIIQGICIMLIWIVLSSLLLYKVWKKGLREYAAVGR
jgi:ABC-2 type transport system permease protein